MNQAGFFRQFLHLLRHSLAAEFASRERLLSPVLFSLTVLLLFWFGLGELRDEEAVRAYVAQTYLAAFFSLQMSFARIFEPEQQDGAFDLMRAYPVSPTAWFLAKLTTVWLTGAVVLTASMAFGAFFHSQIDRVLLDVTILAIGLATLLGLGSIGIMLASITLRSGAKQILFPLIYFPLTVPLLLAATQASQMHIIDGASIESLQESWFGLLVAFDVIYLALGLMLYDQLLFDEGSATETEGGRDRVRQAAVGDNLVYQADGASQDERVNRINHANHANQSE